MRRHIASLLIASGALMVLIGAGTWTGPSVARAQVPAPQPSPRPALDLDGGSRRGGAVAPESGRLTGTVIDSNTGAPVPNVKVIVGNVVVVSDANGNYDHWMAPGTYAVQVVPDSTRAAVVQPPVTVSVTAGGLTVQHLSVRGPQVVPPQDALAAPARAAAPAPISAAQAPAQDAPAPHDGPRVLPRTGLEADGGVVWLGAGLALLLLGWLVWGRPVARLAPALSRPSRLPASFDPNAMLASLLGARESRPAPRDELLESLLASEEREQRAR